ncbi:MAG: NUDIX hydrolase [Acidimicrobiia bacterium]
MRFVRVAGGLIETDDGLLLVCNQRRGGRCDWSPPGGVIDDTDDDVISGLSREVHEETQLSVTSWAGPYYRVIAEAPHIGWHLTVEVFRAQELSGSLTVADPDNIVIDAGFFSGDDMHLRLRAAPRWVSEPLTEWLTHRWEIDDCREFSYRIDGTGMHDMKVHRV